VEAPQHAKNIVGDVSYELHIAYISIGGNKYDLVIIDDYSRLT
jgi:hypothetical protein